MSKISVIVPVYKVEKYIHRCVDSILNQTFPDFELILVDDGSPDNCGAICDEYAAKDNRVVVIHQENAGLSAARNAGIDRAFANSDSEWLTFIDSDDWVQNAYLEKLYNAAIQYDAFVSVSYYKKITDDMAIGNPEYSDVQLMQPESFYSEHITTATIACGKLYRRSCFQNIRYPVGKFHEDEFVTYKILFAEDKLCVIPDPLYYYYVNQQGIMKSQWTPKRLDAIEAFEERARFFYENHYCKALEKSVKAMLFTISRMMTEIRGSSDLFEQYADSYRFLQRKLRCYLFRYGKRFGIHIENHCYAFEAAYPGTMKMYWYGLAILRKLGIKRRK